MAANRALRDALRVGCDERGLRLVLTPLQYCTDNGAMIAAMGSYLLAAGRSDTLALEARSSGAV